MSIAITLIAFGILCIVSGTGIFVALVKDIPDATAQFNRATEKYKEAQAWSERASQVYEEAIVRYGAPK